MKVLILFVASFVLAGSTALSIEHLKSVPIHRNTEWHLGRIIDGEEASPGQFPYQVILKIVTSYSTKFCGAALIHPNWVLTAAHCVSSPYIDHIEVTLGIIDIEEELEDEEQRAIAIGFIIHPDYDSTNFNNNIALVEIPTVTLGDSIKAISLADDIEETYNDELCTVSGWGRTSDDGPSSNRLKFISVYVISNIECSAAYDAEIVIDSTLCTEAATCIGDSGSPLTVDGVLVGIVSFGAEESCFSFPSAFTRVSHFKDWILENTNGDISL